MTTTLSTTCFTVQNNQIVEGTLADFDYLIETTTRPTGVGYKYYATTITRTPEETAMDIWVLAKWTTWNGPEVVVRECESEEEANQAAEEKYIHDILNNNEFSIYLDRSGAEAELAMLKEEDEE